MIDWQFVTNFLLALLAIVNPLGKIPVWIEASKLDRRQVRVVLALLVTLTGALLLTLFLLFGQFILEFFGVDLASFRVGGGIVILVVGMNMLNGQAVDLDLSEPDENQSALAQAKLRFGEVIVPLVVPFIAGPGSITTVLLYGARSHSLAEDLVLVGVLVGVMSLVLVTLLLGHRVRAWVGDLPLRVLTRIFGLILVAVAAQFIVEGLGEAFPNWLTPASPLQDDVS